MTEQELRELVRRVVADRLAGVPTGPGGSAAPTAVPLHDVRAHASHATFRVPEGSETGGPCVIEPGVSCNHCGYCKSMGH